MVDLAHSPTLAAAATARGERLAAGTAIGEYEIEAFLGAGAMGEVYAGRHPVIGKRVAIKLLRAELAASPEAAERFIREARAANAIDHANVIDVFAFGRYADRLYLVMDLVDGRSLRAVLADGPLPLARAIEILAPIADALDAGHARGVVHRDLKPDNIMIADSGKVLVLDFGIAKLLGTDAAAGALTGQGTWLGTPGYMAPEQWSADGAGPASDRYALGMIAYELLAGKLAFSATSAPAMMEQHFRAEVPALGSPADPALRRMLAKDPDARFATGRAFVDALRAAAGQGARRSWLPAAAAAGVLAVGLVAVVAVRGGGHEDRPAAIAAPHEPVVHVASIPPGASVSLEGRVIGTTPLEVHGAGELTIAKPGFLAEHRPAAGDVTVTLSEISQFQGAWRLPDGELRAFERAGDQVDVYKLAEVAGPRVFYKHYPFVPAEPGIAFASDDVVIDQRGSDAACQVPVHLEYRYDPHGDTLELHRPVVTIDIVDGHCVPRSHEVTVERLTRVDAAHEVIAIPAPRGGRPRTSVPRTVARPTAPPSYTNAGQANAASAQAPMQQVLPEPQASVPIQQQGPPQVQKK